MRVLVLCLLLAPMASAGFQVHSVTPPPDRLAPDIQEGRIEVDLDVDCQSIWIHDPYEITIDVASNAIVSGPTSLSLPMSTCTAPQGISEQILSYTVTVPFAVPAYTPIPVGFQFTSGNHVADPAESHAGATTVQSRGAPAITVLTNGSAVQLPTTNVTLMLHNTGNTDVNVTWNATDIPGILALEIPTIPRGGNVSVQATLLQPAVAARVASIIVLTPWDLQGREGPEQQAIVVWEPAPAAPVEESPMPLLWVPLLLAFWLQRQSRPTSTDTA